MTIFCMGQHVCTQLQKNGEKKVQIRMVRPKMVCLSSILRKQWILFMLVCTTDTFFFDPAISKVCNETLPRLLPGLNAETFDTRPKTTRNKAIMLRNVCSEEKDAGLMFGDIYDRQPKCVVMRAVCTFSGNSPFLGSFKRQKTS